MVSALQTFKTPLLHPSEKHAFSLYSLFRISQLNDNLKSRLFAKTTIKSVVTVETVRVTMMRLGMRAAATKKTSQCLAGIIDLKARLTSAVKSQACLRPGHLPATKMTTIVGKSLVAVVTRGPHRKTP